MEILTAVDPNVHNHSRSPVDNILSNNKRAPEKKEILDQCREFESVLVNSMLKSMRNTVEKSDLFSGGKGGEIYTALLDQQYAVMISKNSRTGLAEELYRQVVQDDMKNNKNQEEVPIVNKLM